MKHTIERWPLVLVFLTGISLAGNIWLMRREFVRQKFVEMHDVRVIERKDDLVFQMDVEDPDTHSRVPFMIRFCPDYIPTREIQAGVILSYLKYERHELDNCSEIAPDTLGYTLRRDEHAKPVTFDPGEAATEATTRPTPTATQR